MATKYLMLIALGTAVIGNVHCCPQQCICSDKYNHQFADCAYKDLLEVPVGLPSNVTTVSLSANKIKVLKSKTFINVTQVTSLWLAHNEIVTVERDTLAPMIQLRNLDISYNKIVHFPWEDLTNLTALQMLKMNNNEMVSIPKNAFSNLKDLRSVRINDNKFTTIVQGTFGALTAMSHLQIFHNPFICSCKLEWLRDWIIKSSISIPDQNNIICDAPSHLKGTQVTSMPKLDCKAPSVSITYQTNILSPRTHLTMVDKEQVEEENNILPFVGKCEINDGMQYTSNHAFNLSLNRLKQYTFDFGVIALEVSETEAKVQLNPFQKSNIHLSQQEDLQAVNKEPSTKKSPLDMLYLCVSTDNGYSVLQWSKIEVGGVSTYRFQGLKPGTNYSLCFTYESQDCQVQVVFSAPLKWDSFSPSVVVIVL
ncbi:immunoglobulin superfamily containing leucine-rich repeat protein 2-like [Chanodichthys erythropterus]|uniref:immunoglobulin superfamily containing leucine-rich repeat protein 2-like n=1 Tax=Chanodichthys erythropterus TaxID=933992 RepID=UPI00351F030A